MSPQERRSLTLSPEEWAQLETLAVKYNAIATRGPNIGQPSWRALVRLIAQGQLTTHALDLAYNCRNCGMQTKPSIRCSVCGFIIRQTSDE